MLAVCIPCFGAVRDALLQLQSGIVVSDHFCTFLQESAKAAAELARDFAPDIECKWGDVGLEEIMGDSSIMGVAVVLAGQVQVGVSHFE
jgi:hypothetical protein